MMSKKKTLLADFPLNFIYDRRVNQGMWLTLATVSLILCFYLAEHGNLAVYSVLATLPVMIAGVNQPEPHFLFRLFRVALLFSGVSLLVLFLHSLFVPLALIYLPLIFVLAMFAVRGNRSSRIGTAAMIVSGLSLSWPGDKADIFWVFPLLMGLGTLWYASFSRLWMFWWGHRMLRDTLADLFTEIANYYTLKSKLFLKKPSSEELKAVTARQEKVYDLINQSKSYLNRFAEKGYNDELQSLEQDFLFAVDLMELLQANKHRIREIRHFLLKNNLDSHYSGCIFQLTAVLRKKSFSVRTRRQTNMRLDSKLSAFEKTILESEDSDRLLARSLATHFNLIKNLLSDQRPAFQRSLGRPDPIPSLFTAIRPHLNFQSAVFCYALRLSITVSCGILLAEWLDIKKSYWVILSIIFVMQSGYLLTKTLIVQRVFGTLGGVLLGFVIIYLSPGTPQLVVAMIALGLFSLSMVSIHKKWTVFGVTALVVVSYQAVFGQGTTAVYYRLLDTTLGCGLAFISNIFLWPQWQGGVIKRLLKETLAAQEDILIICVRALSDPSIRFEQLSRRRLKLYTAQNNLLASYQQMLREPYHTQQYVDTLEGVLKHFMATSAHINGLLSMCRDNVPITSDLSKHLERLITAMFSYCDEGNRIGNIILDDELTCVYQEIERIKKEEGDSTHYAILHLLELIFERLNANFDLLDFCGPMKASVHSGEEQREDDSLLTIQE